MIFFALLFSSAAFVSLPFSILTFSVFGRLAATCSALILPLVLFCVWCCCCFCLSRVFVFGFFCLRSASRPVRRSTGHSTGQPVNRPGQPVNWAFHRSTAPVSRSTGHSTGQPVNRFGQPVNRATGKGGVNRDPVSRLPGRVGRLPPYSIYMYI